MTHAKATTVLKREASKEKELSADVMIDLGDGRGMRTLNMRTLRINSMYSLACMCLHMYSLLYYYYYFVIFTSA